MHLSLTTIMSFFAGYQVTLVYQETAMQMLLKKKQQFAVPYTDLKPLIYTHIHSQLQQEWDSQPNNKLHKICSNVLHIPPLIFTIQWKKSNCL